MNTTDGTQEESELAGTCIRCGQPINGVMALSATLCPQCGEKQKREVLAESQLETETRKRLLGLT